MLTSTVVLKYELRILMHFLTLAIILDSRRDDLTYHSFLNLAKANILLQKVLPKVNSNYETDTCLS